MFRKSVFCLLVLTGYSASVQAQTVNEGCDVLADVVQRSVAARSSITMRPRSWPEFGLYRCSNTAAAVTQAFSESMSQLLIPVQWVSPGISPGDVCLSHDIDQCYPRGEMFSDSALPGQYQFMLNSWDAVQSSLQLTIQRSLAPDVSFFQTGTLEQTVRQQLQTRTRSTGQRLYH